jgi:AraC-like DNA-binding protein
LRIYYASTQQEINKKLKNLNFVRTATKIEILKRLNLAKEFMSNNYNRKFRLEEIAGVACLSPNHLLRTFKQAFGISPYQYLSSIKLQRAKILLETGHYSVNEVVLEVGFESTSTFIKVFKANFGQTPLKYSKAKSMQLKLN